MLYPSIIAFIDTDSVDLSFYWPIRGKFKTTAKLGRDNQGRELVL